MVFDRVDAGRFTFWIPVGIGIVALSLLVTSFFVDVRIIVERPAIGDITPLLGTVWRSVLALATLGSFVIALRNFRTDSSTSGGPARRFEIRDENHDIDFHLHLSDLSGEATRSHEDERADDSEPEGKSDETPEEPSNDGDPAGDAD